MPVVTTFNIDAYVYDALRAGASGFLLKDAPPAELVNGIRTVARGESLLAPAVTRHLIGHFAAPTSKPEGARAVPPCRPIPASGPALLSRSMSDLPEHSSATIDAIVGHTGRSTLPFQRAHQEEQHATAFWFNELVETTSEGDVIRQYLVTAGEPARVDLAEFTLRPELCAPVMSAQKLMMLDFAEGWTHLGDLGVAVMPSAGLHAHGARKGWHWTTDEITDGIAATEQDIAALGESPVPAYLLGHVNDGDTPREQAVVIGWITRKGDGSVEWIGDLPQGCVGAPVFIGAPVGEGSFKLVCVGVMLPADDHHTIAPFDRIRAALSAVPSNSAPAPAENEPGPRPTEPKRRWWRRRR